MPHEFGVASATAANQAPEVKDQVKQQEARLDAAKAAAAQVEAPAPVLVAEAAGVSVAPAKHAVPPAAVYHFVTKTPGDICKPPLPVSSLPFGFLEELRRQPKMVVLSEEWLNKSVWTHPAEEEVRPGLEHHKISQVVKVFSGQ